MRPTRRQLNGLALASAVALLGASGTRAGPADRTHVVKRGDSLWRIAANHLGDPHAWQALYRANRDQIKNPALLYPGQELAIPEPAEPPVSSAPPRNGD